MSVLTILEVPDPILKRKCAPVAEIDARIATLLEDMLETMYAAPGIGLAASQIGVLERVMVVDVSENKDRPYRMINPEIVWSSAESDVQEEGCLSLPKQYADVKRPSQVKITYLDEAGANHELEAEGLLGRCIQHELDHLEGILFTDRLSALKRSMLMRRLNKQRRLAS